MKVLYCCQHPASIFRAIIHRFKYHPDSEALFFTERPPGSKDFCLPFSGITYVQMPTVHTLVSLATEKLIIQEVQKQIDAVCKKQKIILSEFEQRYCLYDMYNPFCLYFVLNKLQFSCVETVNNFFSYYSQDDFVNMRGSKPYNSLIRKLHLQDAGAELCVKGYLYSEQSRKPDFDKDFEVWDYQAAIMQLNDNIKRQIFSAFALDKYENSEGIVLFNSQGLVTHSLTSQYNDSVNHLISNNELFIDFYKTTLDYYLAAKNYSIKFHPATSDAAISAFTDCNIIPKTVIAEVLPLVKTFDVFCPLHSASCDAFKINGSNVTELGVAYYGFYAIIHFVYTALSLISRLTDKHCTIGVCNIPVNQIQKFYDFNSIHNNLKADFVNFANNTAEKCDYIICNIDDASNFEMTCNLQSARYDAMVIVNKYIKSSLFASHAMTIVLKDKSERIAKFLKRYDVTVLSNNSDILDCVKKSHILYHLPTTAYTVEAYAIEAHEVFELKNQVLQFSRIQSQQSAAISLNKLQYEIDNLLKVLGGTVIINVLNCQNQSDEIPNKITISNFSSINNGQLIIKFSPDIMLRKNFSLFIQNCDCAVTIENYADGNADDVTIFNKNRLIILTGNSNVKGRINCSGQMLLYGFGKINNLNMTYGDFPQFSQLTLQCQTTIEYLRSFSGCVIIDSRCAGKINKCDSAFSGFIVDNRKGNEFDTFERKVKDMSKAKV
jgi:hypothetical protein